MSKCISDRIIEITANFNLKKENNCLVTWHQKRPDILSNSFIYPIKLLSCRIQDSFRIQYGAGRTTDHVTTWFVSRNLQLRPSCNFVLSWVTWSVVHPTLGTKRAFLATKIGFTASDYIVILFSSSSGHMEPLHLLIVQKDYILSSSIANRIGVHITNNEPTEVS